MRLKLSLIIVFVLPAMVAATDTKLFSMSIGHKAATPGVLNNYKVTFTEVERAETTSVLEIVHEPSRYTDWGDLLMGMCGLLKARGEKFMLNTPRSVSTDPLRQEVTFLKSAPESDQERLRAGIVSLSQCEQYFPQMFVKAA